MRSLEGKDLGLFSKMVDKMDATDEITALSTELKSKIGIEGAELDTTVIVKLGLIIISNYWKAEPEFFALLSALTDKSVKEIGSMKLKEIVGYIKELAKDESLPSFFSSVV